MGTAGHVVCIGGGQPVGKRGAGFRTAMQPKIVASLIVMNESLVTRVVEDCKPERRIPSLRPRPGSPNGIPGADKLRKETPPPQGVSGQRHRRSTAEFSQHRFVYVMSGFGDSVGPKSQCPKFKNIGERLAETRWLDHPESPNRPGFFRARVGQTAGGEYFSRPLFKRRPRSRACMPPICLQPFPRRPGLLDAEVGVRVVHYRIEPAVSSCFSKARFGDPLLERFPGWEILWFLSAPALQEAGASRTQLRPNDLWNLFRSFRDDTNPQNDHVPFRKSCCCFVQPLPGNAEGLLQSFVLTIASDADEVCGFSSHHPRPVSGGGRLDCRSRPLYFTNSPVGSERRIDRCYPGELSIGNSRVLRATFAGVLAAPGAWERTSERYKAIL